VRHGPAAVVAGSGLWWLATGLHTPLQSATFALGLSAAAVAGGTRAAAFVRLVLLAAGGLGWSH
jgi:hypothetical protein